MNKLNKMFVIVLVSSLATTSINANAFWWGLLLRTGATGGARTVVTRAVGGTIVKNQMKKTFARRIGEAVVINGVTMTAMSAYVKEEDFEYNQNGVKYQEAEGTIYLGKGCEVESPVYGQGMWVWDDNGWYVLINDDNKTILSYDLSELPKFSSEVLATCNVKNFN